MLDALKDLAQLDVLTLQEVRFARRTDFKKYLADKGFNCCPDTQRHTRGKDYGNLIASRWTIEPCEPRYSRDEPPWHELLVQASVSHDGRSFLVITVHIPNGSFYGWKKIDTFKALREVVLEAKGKPCIVTGDFNEPQLIPLQDDGHIVTWGQYWEWRPGRYECWDKLSFRRRKGWGKDWDAAVRWLFEKEDEHGMRHAYWDTPHGRGVMPVSYVTARDHQPRWFDHMFVSRNFRVERCEYLHELRYERHSDHSALEATLLLKP